jgi:acyl carrier protein
MATVDATRVEEKVFEALAELVDDPGAVRRGATFEALDIDSLDIVELAQILEDELDVRILGQTEAEAFSAEITTVGDAVDALVQRIERGQVGTGA